MTTDLDLVEVKRLDQEESAPLSEVYKWLIVSNKLQKVFELDFKAMSRTSDKQTREFIGEYWTKLLGPGIKNG